MGRTSRADSSNCDSPSTSSPRSNDGHVAKRRKRKGVLKISSPAKGKGSRQVSISGIQVDEHGTRRFLVKYADSKHWWVRAENTVPEIQRTFFESFYWTSLYKFWGLAGKENQEEDEEEDGDDDSVASGEFLVRSVAGLLVEDGVIDHVYLDFEDGDHKLQGIEKVHAHKLILEFLRSIHDLVVKSEEA